MNSDRLEQERQAIDAVVDGLTLFDDDLMSRVFENNIEATELVLGIILGRKIQVVSVEGQEEFKNHKVGGRNIIIDVHAIDCNGEEINIEVQGNTEGAQVRRARFHSSVMDTGMLLEGQPFRKLKDSYVIFIYKYDKFRKGLPIYHVERYVTETGELFEDGSHIIYVNGSYKGNDEIGQLMTDFHQTDPAKIHYDELSRGIRHYKEKGRGQMCEAVEKYAKEYAKKYAKEYANREKVVFVQNLMNNMKLTLEQALDALSIRGDERESIKKELQK